MSLSKMDQTAAAAAVEIDAVIAATAEAILTGVAWATATPYHRRQSCLFLRDLITDYETVSGEAHPEDGLYSALERVGVDLPTHGHSDFTTPAFAVPIKMAAAAPAAVTFSGSLEQYGHRPLATVADWR